MGRVDHAHILVLVGPTVYDVRLAYYGTIIKNTTYTGVTSGCHITIFNFDLIRPASRTGLKEHITENV